MKAKTQRTVIISAAVACAGLVVLYFSLSRIVLHSVNRTLEDGLPGYQGRVGGIELSLLRGGYLVKDVEINKVDNEEVTPFFRAESVDFTLFWSALLRGELAGEVELESPEITFIHGDDATETQGGEDGDWMGVIRELTPFELGHGEIRNGTLRFQMTFGEELHEILLTDLNLIAENLSNHRDYPGNIVGEVRATALFAEHAPLQLKLEIDPLADEPVLSANLLLERLEVVRLLPLTRAYANFEFEQGVGEIAAEIAVRDGQIRGYVKPILMDLGVARIDRDIKGDGDGPLLFTWENLVGFFAFLLTDQTYERMATIVPITGTLESPDIGVWRGLANAFRNAYGTAIESGLQNNTDLQGGFVQDPDQYVEMVERDARVGESADAADVADSGDEGYTPPDVMPHSQRRATAP